MRRASGSLLEVVSKKHEVDEEWTAIETNSVRPACFKSTAHEVLFVLTATMAVAMGSLLTGSVTVTSSFIGRDLNMTTAEITWITSACSLSNGAFLLFFGRVADLFGRKILFVGSLFLFSVFTLVAGFAKSGISLDILNGIIGLTCASAIPPAVGLLGVIYEKPSKRKNYAFACFSAGNPMGFVLGTIFGGLATSLFGWRASFWLIAIIFLIFTVIGAWTVPKDFTSKEPLNWETLKKFDVVGTILIVFGIGMFSAALSLGSDAPHGWKTDYVLALLIIGVFLMVAFVICDLYYPYPLIPMSIWRDRNFTLCLLIMMIGLGAFTPGMFFIALYLQEIWNLDALMVAVHMLPMAIVGFFVNIVAGLILHKVSNKLLMLIGALGYSISFLLAAVNRESSSYFAFIFPSFILVVMGADLEFNVANMYVMSSMPASQQSIAGGIFQTAAKLCMTVGFGIATAIYSSVEHEPSLSHYWDAKTQPYSAVFWFSFATCMASVCMVPFLTIGTQGGTSSPGAESDRGIPAADEAREKAVAQATIMPATPGRKMSDDTMQYSVCHFDDQGKAKYSRLPPAACPSC